MAHLPANSNHPGQEVDPSCSEMRGMKDGSTATASLLDFRERLYSCVPRRADALFELCEAVLSAGPVPSPPHLSLASMHRRSWGSLYAALSRGRIDAQALRDLLAEQPLEENPNRARVYAVDRSSWPRCDAESSPKRGSITTRRATLLANRSLPAGPTKS
jgi:hypothetical protein